MQAVRRTGSSAYIFKSPFKRWAAGCLDAVGRGMWPRRRKSEGGRDVPRRILVVRMDQIGDAVFAEPAVAYLTELFPQAAIDFLCGPWAAPLVGLFSGVSETLVFEHNWHDPRRRFWRCCCEARKILWAVRARRYDLAIDLRGDVRTLFLLRLAGIPRIAGYGVTGGRFLLDCQADYDFSAHQVDLNLRLVEEAAADLQAPQSAPVGPRRRVPRLFIPDAIREAVRDSGWMPGFRPRVLLHMEPGCPSKGWGKDRFVRVAAALCRRGAHVVLIGLERDDFCRTQELADFGGRLTDGRGKTNLLEVCGLIAQGDLLIGCDSAPAHIAAAVGTPCVVLFSGANEPSRWSPRGEDVPILFHPVECSPCESRECTAAAHRCMESITAAQVEEAAVALLARKGYFR